MEIWLSGLFGYQGYLVIRVIRLSG